MIDSLTIKHEKFDALISMKGAQILEFTPKNSTHSLLWCTDAQYWQDNKPIRGGIPICWPWFGKQREPSHGFARNMHWSLVERLDSPAEVRLTFELTDSPLTRKVWPFPFKLSLQMSLSEKCHLQLVVDCKEKNTGALHTYLNLGDINKTYVSGITRQPLIVDGPIDEIYPTSTGLTKVLDKQWGRVIEQEHFNHSDIVVWNPWEHGFSVLNDISKDDYRTFLCVETASISKPIENYLAVSIAENVSDSLMSIAD